MSHQFTSKENQLKQALSVLTRRHHVPCNLVSVPHMQIALGLQSGGNSDCHLSLFHSSLFHVVHQCSLILIATTLRTKPSLYCRGSPPCLKHLNGKTCCIFNVFKYITLYKFIISKPQNFQQSCACKSNTVICPPSPPPIIPRLRQIIPRLRHGLR